MSRAASNALALNMTLESPISGLLDYPDYFQCVPAYGTSLIYTECVRAIEVLPSGAAPVAWRPDGLGPHVSHYEDVPVRHPDQAPLARSSLTVCSPPLNRPVHCGGRDVREFASTFDVGGPGCLLRYSPGSR